ncbi:MAG TPA: selenium metabolism-associated LysR family transcriptional regulator [Syntrophales bacterium]|nr:selenium metabolism-associated LysR family transcriptional regulator [Syntrophales bacterium]
MQYAPESRKGQRKMAFDGFRNMTIQQLEALIHLVEERSFSRAARRMNLTQPSLTKHIRNVEEILGSKVVNRASRSLALTPEGKVLHDYARRILRLRDEAREQVLRMRETDSGDIRIAASTIPATYILPYALGAFRRKHPRIRATLLAADSSEVIQMVLENGAEIGFIGKKPPGGKLIAEALWKDRLVLAASAEDPLAKRRSVRLVDLREAPFVIREKGSGTRETMESCLRDADIPGLSHLNIVAELGSSEAVKEAILAGLGISMISAHAIRRELRSGLAVALSIDECRMERSFYLIYRRQFDLMSHHERFLDFIRMYRPENPLQR